MDFTFLFNEEQITLMLENENKSFLSRIFSHPRHVKLTDFAKEDQGVALALGDLNFWAQETKTPIFYDEKSVNFS